MPASSPRESNTPSRAGAESVARGQAGNGRGAILLTAAVAWTVGFSAWFFQLELPNNPQVSRPAFWSLVPEQLADLALPADGREGSGRWANLGQRLDLYLVAALIVAGAWGLGQLVLAALRLPADAGRAEKTVFAFGCGFSLLTLAVLGCGLAGWLSRGVLGGIVAVGIVGGTWVRLSSLTSTGFTARQAGKSDRRHTSSTRRQAGKPDLRTLLKPVCLIVAAPFVLAMLLGSTLPPTDFDAKAYHLVAPKEWFQQGRITFLPHNVYASFPFLTEMPSLAGMVLRDDWYRGALAGQAVLMSFAPLTALAVYAAGRRWFSPAAGWLGALVYLTTPWTYRISTIAYAEGGLSFFLIAALLATGMAVERRTALSSDPGGADRRPSERMFLLAGLLAGSAMACKYTGLVQVVIPLGLAAAAAAWRWRAAVRPDEPAARQAGPDAAGRTPESRRSNWSAVRVALVFSAGVLVTVGPWLLRNAVQTGNPVYPLLYSVFGGRAWDDDLAARFRAGHSSRAGQYTPSHFAANLIDVLARNDWHTPLLFGLAPLALLVRRKRAGQASRVGQAASLPDPHSPAAEAGSFGHEPRPERAAAWLWACAAYLFLAWWLLTHRIDRFWVPMIPIVAVLAGAGAAWCRHVAWRATCGLAIVAAVAFNLAFVSTALAGNNAWLGDLARQRQAAEGTAPTIAMLNELYDAGRLGPEPKVLLVGDAQVFDARFPHAYSTVFNRSTFEEFFVEQAPAPDGRPRLAGNDEIRARLSAAGITHVVVNWQEVLRYRTTYGYSDFVTPSQFSALVERQVLTPPATLSLSGRPVDELPPAVRQQLDRWGPELLVAAAEGQRYIAAQLYAVRE